MSSLQRQADAFTSDLKSSASKISNKRALGAPVTSVPSHLPPNSTTTGQSKSDSSKRKRPEPTNVVYSQPADTGRGAQIMTQVTYARDYLKTKETPRSLKDIVEYLNLHKDSTRDLQQLAAILKRDDRITFVPESRNASWNTGTYSYAPKLAIRTKNELLGYLQQRPDASGLPLKDLKDGWPNADTAIDELEEQSLVLVTRNKKDGHARHVWPNDPSLKTPIDEEYQMLWNKIVLPSAADIVQELHNAHLKPTSVDPSSVIKKMSTKKEKTKKPRRGGRTTNTHMAGILRDYSRR
jgi:transcription initiation factor TFIIE subunit beta